MIQLFSQVLSKTQFLKAELKVLQKKCRQILLRFLKNNQLKSNFLLEINQMMKLNKVSQISKWEHVKNALQRKR